MSRADYSGEFYRDNPNTVGEVGPVEGRGSGVLIAPTNPTRPVIIEPSVTPTDSGPINLPSGEITNTVLIGAFLAIVGNNLLKPLFALIIRNFESDQKATGDVVKLLKERITKLEKDNTRALNINEKQAEEHSKYMRSLDVANSQAANIAKILQNQSEQIGKMAESVRQLSIEVSDHRLGVQRQIDTLAQHVNNLTDGVIVSPSSKSIKLKRRDPNG